jgi:hypothetical protein
MFNFICLFFLFVSVSKIMPISKIDVYVVKIITEKKYY